MPATFPKSATSAKAVSKHPSSTHPAYGPLFAHYREAGQSATRALALLAKNWDEDAQGPLPSARTARHWALVDGWDAKVEADIAASVTPYHAYVEMQLLKAGVEAVATLNRVINGEYPQPRLAHAVIRAAVATLERAGFGPPGRSGKTSRAA
jgi:hypothetical protein